MNRIVYLRWLLYPLPFISIYAITAPCPRYMRLPNLPQKWLRLWVCIEQRAGMLRCTDVHRGNLSFYLGGKSPSDDTKWSPNMQAVRATIRFAIATGRLEAEQPQNEAK